MATEFMPLDDVLANYRDGDEHGWQEEFDWLWAREPGYMDRLATSIQEMGMREPILLGNDGRVWDGHHRLAIAQAIGYTPVPVRHVPAGLMTPKQARESVGDPE